MKLIKFLWCKLFGHKWGELEASQVLDTVALSRSCNTCGQVRMNIETNPRPQVFIPKNP